MAVNGHLHTLTDYCPRFGTLRLEGPVVLGPVWTREREKKSLSLPGIEIQALAQQSQCVY